VSEADEKRIEQRTVRKKLNQLISLTTFPGEPIKGLTD
jgi:hypothetical protein